jgi:creatinine amidohydrolase
MIECKRSFAALTSTEVVNCLNENSVLCLPIGSFEQHGPHLPLNTDTVIANVVAARIVNAYHCAHDLWLLPAIDYGISPEHLWAPGTISLSTATFCVMFDEFVRGLIAAQPARNLLIVNGHGGNRGVLDALIQECRVKYSLAACVIHPSALSRLKSGSAFHEVHGGKSETSVMLAIAPTLVRRDHLPPTMTMNDGVQVEARVLDRAVSWPWHSGEQGIGRQGVIGDAASASADLGLRIVESCVHNAEAAVRSLIDYGHDIRNSKRARTAK